MDKIDCKLLETLHGDGRMTVKSLSEHINLSQPSCAERLRRLQDQGIIEKFSVQLSPSALGFPITAIVRVRPLPGELNRVEKLIAAIKEITQCDKVTGDDAFFCRLHLRHIEELDICLSKISRYATTSTSIVKSSPVANRLLPLRSSE
ncbi:MULTISPECIES: Lrp/AsnC family transcriptional regulator [unclassified Brenneria]|uniref:Lrp/AsnC family transcriptional regulator n=1 Tax=unclassified Brenneria TaxID=2634434 RepID=UPI00155659B5|nr:MULTISPECIES: Lrp/AsnC family transcriptional regulator [unclassified Brenneria]MBJ7220372.1 Lrp/AsnC family transcriptional regulator [Brenneria sp. L3-3C-1]MEE3641616.1 Lrp/AsnC family transcriptional regulator [Brenneria sp. L3_3C_1]MEE3649753.1 Lrp/AsnC family transcriptional regulator [Brenneria sp. HEZEL_4_2_4]NPC99711.1 Lrp/AsnC family transcriptional regulator [Brenneria sp. hezel4-2-4]